MGAAAIFSLFLFDRIGLALDNPGYLYTQLFTRGDIPRIAIHAAAVVLPASIVMGFLFPIAARLESQYSKSAGTTIGRIYAYNTAGGILGSMLIGFWSIGAIGTHASFQILAGFNAILGLAALTLSSEKRSQKAEPLTGPTVLCFAALLAAFALSPRDRTLEILGRRIARAQGAPPKYLFHEEAAEGTATGIQYKGKKQLYINGIVIAGTGFNGGLMTGIPNVFQEKVERTLIVGVGAGTSLVSASILGGEVHAAELVRPVAEHLPDFQPGFAHIYGRPQTKIFFEDGRNFLLRAQIPYDSIIIDGSPPLFSAGTANLYSVDFLNIVRDRLSEKGVFTLWLPLPSFEEDYWNILKGMNETFPHVRVWNHPDVSAGLIFFGSKSPLKWEPGVLDRRLAKRVRPYILTGLTEKTIRAGFQITPEEASAYAQKYRRITDDRPLSEYPLGKLMRAEPYQTDHSFLLKAKSALNN
jgi:spermidine synthase